MSFTHTLKTEPAPFAALWSREKTCEFRLDDRAYKSGDTLLLREYEPVGATFTGRGLAVRVTHVQHGYGIPPGYAMLSVLVYCRYKSLPDYRL